MSICPAPRLVGILALLILTPSVARAQQEAEGSQASAFRSGATAVVLDVVVRDKRGRPIRDVQQGELTVLEDGKPRDLRSFRLVERANGAMAPAPAGDPAAPDVLRHPTLMVLVFDHLTQNARALAKRAALQFVGREMAPDVWVAVYGLDGRLRPVQSFTRDREALTDAVMRATEGADPARDRLAATASDEERIRRAADATLAGLNTGRPAPDGSAIGAAFAEARVAEVISRIERLVESADVQQRAQSTLFPLMALMKAQASLAGRKALLLFSEGVPVPPNLEEAYRSAISEANRANVSVYAVDVRGLDTGRALDQSRQMLDRSARNSQAQIVSGGSQRPVTMDDVMNSETAEGALRADKQDALRALAEETGGALIANTNDLGPGLVERVTADLDSYYEIAYTPLPVPPDGRFRKVEVKIARRGVTVHSRSGYFALPEGDAAPLMPYELPMLLAAATDPPPRPFTYAARAFRFHGSPAGVQHTLLVEVPLEHLTFTEHRRTYALRFTVMALVKDGSGEIVQRFSEAYPLEGPSDRLPALKRGRIRFKRQFTVAPGKYTVWTVARDQASERSSVLSFPLEVPEPAPGLQISDVSIIRSVDRAGDAPDVVEDPFRTEGMRIAPNLNLPISRAANEQISAYVSVRADAGALTPTLTFEFVRNGKPVGRSAAQLPEPDSAGRIKFVSSFPTGIFEPGNYVLRATASHQGRTATSQTEFVVTP